MSESRRPMRGWTGLVPVAVAVTLALGLLAPLAAVSAKLTTSRTVTANAFATGTVFSGARATSAWSLADASSGTSAAASDSLSYPSDARTTTTGAFAAASSASRYVQLQYYGTMPSGLAASAAAFKLNVATVNGANTCVYFDVRRVSTGAVLATHGSAASPILCTTSTTPQATSTALPEVTTSDLANDLAVRVYASSSTSKGIVIDLATVTVTAASTAFTLYESSLTDVSTGTATTTPWALAAAEGTAYTSSSNWPTSFSTTRYIQLSFPAVVPAAATISSVTYVQVWKAATSGDTVADYIQVYNGATLIGSHGSSASPLSSNTGGTTWTTDTVALPEVSSASIANNLVIRFFARSTGGRKSLTDQVRVSLTYSVP